MWSYMWRYDVNEFMWSCDDPIMVYFAYYYEIELLCDVYGFHASMIKLWRLIYIYVCCWWADLYGFWNWLDLVFLKYKISFTWTIAHLVFDKMPIYRILRKWKVQCTSYESDGYIIIEMMMKCTHVYDFLYISVVSRPSLVRGVVGPYNHIEGLVPWLPSTGGSRPV